MRVEAVLFDWNQTLFGDELVAYGSMVAIFEAFGVKPPTIRQYLTEISSDWMSFYRKYGIPGDITPEALNMIRVKYYVVHDREAKLRDDAKNIILRLRLMRMITGIVSGEVESLLDQKLIQNGLLALMDTVRGGVRGNKTPALLEACWDINVRPAQVIYVDDTPDGTRAARDAGMIPVGFCNGYNSPELLRKVTGEGYLVRNFTELYRIVEEINDWA